MMRTRILFLVARVMGVVVALVTTPIVARLLGLDGMAQLVVLSSWAAVAAAVADAGGVIRFQQDAKHGAEPRAIFGDVWLLRLLLLAILGVVGMALVPSVGAGPVLVVLGVTIGQSVSGLVIGVLPSTSFASRVVVVDFLGRAGAGLLAILVAWLTGSGAATALAAAAPALVAIAALPARWWRVSLSGWWQRISIARQVQLALVPVAGAVLLRSDVILLGLLGASAEEVGAFATISRLTEFVLMLAVGLLGFMLPDLHGSGRPAVSGQRWVVLALAACVGLALGSGLSQQIAWVLGGPALADYVSPYSGWPAAQLLAPMLLALGLRLVSDVLIGFMLWERRARAVLAVLLIDLLVRGVIASLTVPSLGYAGTALSMVVAELVATAVAVTLTTGTGIWDSPLRRTALATSVVVLCILAAFALEPSAWVLALLCVSALTSLVIGLRSGRIVLSRSTDDVEDGLDV